MLALMASAAAALMPGGNSQALTGVCGKHYVAGGDDVPAGNTLQSGQSYPGHLQSDHAVKYGYCLYNLAQNGTTSSKYISASFSSNREEIGLSKIDVACAS